MKSWTKSKEYKMYSSINLHDVKKVEVRSQEVEYANEKIKVMVFSFIDKEGNKTEVSAYSNYNEKISLYIGA